LTAVNFFREMGGLQPVVFDSALSVRSQEAALMMAAAGRLSHFPDPAWPCYSEGGYQGASSSNLYLGRAGADAIAGYMVDPGENNTSVGHRRWIMRPEITTMGSGSTSYSNALYVVDQDSWRDDLLPSDPKLSSWPTPGYFPYQLEPLGRWSLDAQLWNKTGDWEWYDTSSATVQVTRYDGTAAVVLPVTIVSSSPLVWEFDPGVGPGAADRRFVVTVDGIEHRRSSVDDPVDTISYEYEVDMFDAEVVPDVPARLLDTRWDSAGTIDFEFWGGGHLRAGEVLELDVGDRNATPPWATAALLNVTVTQPSEPGFVTVYPCGSPLPVASSLNYAAGQTIANAVIAKLGEGGRVCLYTLADTHLVVDVNGYYLDDAGYVARSPARLFDSRPHHFTVDDVSSGEGLRRSGTTTELQVVGRANIPDTADSVVLNVTVTQPSEPGFVTVYPCGSPLPVASSLNYAAGQTIANAVIAKLGEGGRVCLYTLADTHLVVDVNGYGP
jgi:hypothetical protein